MAKTKSRHFKIFKKECGRWINKFHLGEWKVVFRHKDSEKLPDTLAYIFSDWKGRVVTIGLSKDWGVDKINNYQLCKCAFHEVCELMLVDIVSIAQMDICPSQKNELESKIHSMIRRLENAIYKPNYKGGE